MYFKTILTSAKAKHLKRYTFEEAALYSNKEFQRDFKGGPYYPNGNFTWEKGGPY